MKRSGLALLLLGAAACKSPAKGEQPSHARGPTSGTVAGPAPSAPRTLPSVAGVPSVAPTFEGLGEASGSCNWISVVSSCTEAVSKTPRGREAALRALGQVCKSVPERAPCPPGRRVGSCRTLDGFIEHYYAVGGRPYTAEEARAECENRDGRWLE